MRTANTLTASRRAADRENDRHYSHANTVRPSSGGSIPTVDAVCRPDHDVRDGGGRTVGRYVSAMRLAFREDRPVNTRDSACVFCDTVCEAGNAAVVRFGVNCASCNLAFKQGHKGGAPMPADWHRPGLDWGADIDADEQHERKERAAIARPVVRQVLAYTPPAPMPVALDIERGAPPVRKFTPVKPPPSQAASEAGRALAACKRKPSDRKRAAVAAK